MLSSLANYLLGGSFSAAHDSGKETNNDVSVVTRLSQVEVEGEDWILIDRAGTSDLLQTSASQQDRTCSTLQTCSRLYSGTFSRVGIVRYGSRRVRVALGCTWILGDVRTLSREVIAVIWDDSRESHR